jgi:hypothetical protein
MIANLERLDAEIHDAVLALVNGLCAAHPELTRREIADLLARRVLEQAGVKVRLINEFMATAGRTKVW